MGGRGHPAGGGWGWGFGTALVGGISYLLRDEFTDTRAAGAVNGTAATPGPGTRVVVDTTSKLSIGSGVADFNGNSAGDPGLWYGGQTRVAGLLVLCKLDIKQVNQHAYAGWDTDQTVLGQSQFRFAPSSLITETASSLPIGAYTATAYETAVILKATGSYMLIKGGAFSNWTLLWIYVTGNDATMYPGATVHQGDQDLDYIRIPDVTWLPTPLAYDTFTRANGALGTSETTGPDSQTVTARTWESGGSTWAIASNEAVNTPTEGADGVTNGDMELDASWGDLNSPDTNERSAEQQHGGSYSRKIVADTDRGALGNSTAKSAGTWYLEEAWIYVTAGSANIRSHVGGNHSIVSGAAASWTQGLRARLATSDAAYNPSLSSSAPASTFYADDVSAKALTLNTLFTDVDDGATSDIVAQVELDAVTDGFQAGIVLNLDDKDSPANFVIAYIDLEGGDTADLVKYVAGVPTSVISASITYAAGATLVVVKDGTSYALFYNNSKVGSTSTISDAGIISNTAHGLFSTSSSNQLDNFLLFPRGSGNEFSALDLY